MPKKIKTEAYEDVLPELFKKKFGKTTRSRSKEQETNLRKDLARVDGKAFVTPNSGAVFHQNDVVSNSFEIEAKTTGSNSHILTVKYWKEVKKKTALRKTPAIVVRFENEENLQLVIIDYNDFLTLIENQK